MIILKGILIVLYTIEFYCKNNKYKFYPTSRAFIIQYKRTYTNIDNKDIIFYSYFIK